MEFELSHSIRDEIGRTREAKIDAFFFELNDEELDRMWIDIRTELSQCKLAKKFGSHMQP